MKVAVLNDYQNVALQLIDWSGVRRYAEITVFNDHVADPSEVVERLRPFDVVCVMPEDTPLTREIVQQLPKLKLIASTGPRKRIYRHSDRGRSRHRGHRDGLGFHSDHRVHLVADPGEHAGHRPGGRFAEGRRMADGPRLKPARQSLGVVGLGNIGREVARIGLAFGMKGDRLEPESDDGERQRRRRDPRRAWIIVGWR